MESLAAVGALLRPLIFVAEGRRAMVRRFSTMFGGSGRSKDQDSMRGAVMEIATMSRLLVESSMELAKKSLEQRERVREVVATEQQIAAAASGIWASSRSVSEQAMAVSENLEAGNRTVAATNRSMGEMVETVTAGANLMQEFVVRMAEVKRIVGEISGIARQTNLLALNAAIEAAHAGKEGDGFSVIAQEIRVLADRAAGSTTEIAEKIEAMNTSASAAASAMQVGQAAAASSIAENRKVQRSLGSIREAMQEVQRISVEVAEASEKQIVAGKQVTGSVMVVDEMAACASQSSDAAAEMSIKMTTCAGHVQERLGSSPRRGNKDGGDATDRLIQQVEEQEAEVLAALSLLGAKCTQAGGAAVRGAAGESPELHFGSKPASSATDWVDAVHESTGYSATIFAIDAARFSRVATNVKLASGERAVGTALNPNGLAAAALMEGKSYFGAVYVLGKPFVAGYEPVFSAGRTVIGALYVGRPLRGDGKESC